MTTLKDIARAAGVTHSVVSRVLSRDANLRVSAETRSKIFQLSEKLNYTPNAAAKALRSAKSHAIGFAVHDIVNPVYAEIIAGAQSEASKRGNVVLLADAQSLADSDQGLRSLIGSSAIDGIILQSVGLPSDSVIRNAVRRSTRVVLLQEDGHPDYGVVRLPDERAAEMATRHLALLGHTRIGFLATAIEASFTKRRVGGWLRTMESLGLQIEDRDLVYAGSNADAGALGMHHLLKAAPEVTGIVVANVLAAIGALSTARQRGLRIPQDLSIVCLHDSPFAAHAAPPLTAVKMPLTALGVAAVEMLLDAEDPAGRERIISDPPLALVERKSCGRPRPLKVGRRRKATCWD
jgi:DNA-binding LacI/PurR family transcriptional regulator